MRFEVTIRDSSVQPELIASEIKRAILWLGIRNSKDRYLKYDEVTVVVVPEPQK